MISPLVGEMARRPEGGAKELGVSGNLRCGYNFARVANMIG
jgi:hypothetical protein